MATIYDETIKAWRQERTTPDLQPIRPGFFKDLSGYIRRLRESQRNLDQKSLKASVIGEELARLEKLVSQILWMRLQKLWKAAVDKSQVSVDALEKRVYENMSDVARYYQKLESEIIQGREPSSYSEQKKERLTIRFVRDVPSIVGVDLKTYGPFQREDVAVIPYENAEGLIRQGAAVEVQVQTVQK